MAFFMLIIPNEGLEIVLHEKPSKDPRPSFDRRQIFANQETGQQSGRQLQ